MSPQVKKPKKLIVTLPNLRLPSDDPRDCFATLNAALAAAEELASTCTDPITIEIRPSATVELKLTEGLVDRVLALPPLVPTTTKQPPSIYARASRASRAAFVATIFAAIVNAIVGLWHPWYFAFAATMALSAVLWRRVHLGQRALYGEKK